MDRAYLSEIENGHRKPTVDLLDKLAEALDVPFHELFLPPEPGAVRRLCHFANCRKHLAT
jgi:transcriptional regulator with XRE-family HTH domain